MSCDTAPQVIHRTDSSSISVRKPYKKYNMSVSVLCSTRLEGCNSCLDPPIWCCLKSWFLVNPWRIPWSLCFFFHSLTTLISIFSQSIIAVFNSNNSNISVSSFSEPILKSASHVRVFCYLCCSSPSHVLYWVFQRAEDFSDTSALAVVHHAVR